MSIEEASEDAYVLTDLITDRSHQLPQGLVGVGGLTGGVVRSVMKRMDAQSDQNWC
jgi:hypothetical protein